MGIMGCYPDEQSIENAIGGVWEKVETIEVNGSDIFTYDADIDGTPLNVNGIMLVFNVTSSANVTTTTYCGASDNDRLFTTVNGITPNNPYLMIKAKNNNGFYDYKQLASSSAMGGRTTVYSSMVADTTPFVNNYFRFALVVADTATMTGSIDVYFLRGV